MKLYPSLLYKDAKAAHRWLQEAFGFEPVALYEDDAGGVAHAEMRWGSDLVMFGTVRDDRYGERVGQGWVYATCDDPDALYERAKAAGAEITMELTDQEYGSRDFAVRDLEGNHWNFGTYEPT
jgi:uncharacterized glyoxalase superfamily protein PhnB